MNSPALPVTVLTGFLGSGKSTLANRWLGDPAMRDALVIVNEAGDVSVDHHLVRRADERLVVLPNGCVCCAVRDDIVDALADPALLDGRGRVLVETSGLVDPGPLVATIVQHPRLAHLRLERVITTLDATRAANYVTTYPETAKQLAIADVVIITKADLVDAHELAEVEGVARQFAPAARLRVGGPDTLDEEPAEPPVEARLPSAWESAAQQDPHASPRDHAHTHGIRTFLVERAGPVAYPNLHAWLTSMCRFNGDRLLRIKGLVHAQGEPKPVVVQAVQHTVYPMTRLEAWPAHGPRTYLVGITQGMDDAFFDRIVGSLRKTLGDA